MLIRALLKIDSLRTRRYSRKRVVLFYSTAIFSLTCEHVSNISLFPVIFLLQATADSKEASKAVKAAEAKLNAVKEE